MSIYIMDKTNVETGISYAKMDENAKIILIQDGLYAPTDIFEGLKVFAFADEVIERGLEDILPKSIERITYDEGIDIMTDEKIISFC